MSKQPFLSVIIPVYNAKDYLRVCINSVIGQKFKDYELILVDDGSTDISGDICDEYSNSLSNIKVYHIKNGGVSHARNYGLEKAKGKYIHFVDSDDSICSNMYTDYFEVLQSMDYDLLVSGATINYIFNNRKKVLKSDKEVSVLNQKDMRNFLLSLKIEDKTWMLNVIWNKWFKKDFLLEHNMSFKDDICPGEDFIFVVDAMLNIDKLYVSNESYYNYMIRDNNSLVGKFYKDTLVRRPYIYNKHIKLYEKYGLLELYMEYINEYEGRMYFKELLAIHKRSCHLKYNEKLKHLKALLEFKHSEIMFGFLKKHKKITSLILRFGSIYLIYCYLKVYFLLKKMSEKIRHIN